MRQLSRRACLLFLTGLLFCGVPAHAAEKPKVRAITAFVRLESANYKAQIAETLAVLRRAQATFERAGYEVQTLRVTPQPFSVIAKEMPREQVLAFYAEYEALA